MQCLIIKFYMTASSLALVQKMYVNGSIIEPNNVKLVRCIELSETVEGANS